MDHIPSTVNRLRRSPKLSHLDCRALFINIDNGTEVIGASPGSHKQFAAFFTLKCCHPNPSHIVVVQHKIHASITEATNPIVQKNWPLVIPEKSVSWLC